MSEIRTCNVNVLSNEEDLLALREEWTRLAASCINPNPFTSWAWIWSWWRSFGAQECKQRNSRLFTLAVRQSGELCGVLPFMLRSTVLGGRIIRKLEFPDLDFADYMDPMVRGDPATHFTAAFRYLAQHRGEWDVLLLRRIRTLVSLPEAIRGALAVSKLRARARRDEAYLYVPIDSDWAGFLNRRPARFRESLRRKQRKLQGLAANGLQIRVLEDPRRTPDLLAKMAELEQCKVLSGSRAEPMLTRNRSFFEHLFENLGDKLYVATMEAGDHLIAYEFGLRNRDLLWSYTKAYDPRYAAFSPGTMLTPAVFDFACRSGCREYDLLRGQELFKKRLTGHLHRPQRFDVWNDTRRSRVCALLYFRVRASAYRLAFLARGQEVHPDL